MHEFPLETTNGTLFKEGISQSLSANYQFLKSHYKVFYYAYLENWLVFPNNDGLFQKKHKWISEIGSKKCNPRKISNAIATIVSILDPSITLPL